MKFGMIFSQIILTAFLSFILVKANAATPEQDFASELNISPEEKLEVLNVLEDADRKEKARLMFCSDIGASAIGDALLLMCSNFRGKKLKISFLGYGSSLSLHGGLAILYPKKGSRLIKEGTYRHSVLKAVHIGVGFMGINIHNDNESIRYRVKGLTIGSGFNFSEGVILVN